MSTRVTNPHPEEFDFDEPTGTAHTPYEAGTRESPSLVRELLKDLGTSLLILAVGGTISLAVLGVNALVATVPPVFQVMLQLSEISLLIVGVASLSRILRNVFPDDGPGPRRGAPARVPVVAHHCHACARRERAATRRRSG